MRHLLVKRQDRECTHTDSIPTFNRLTRSAEMETNQILDEIREINLGYMLLAQQLLREDKATAMYRLGIGEDVANILENLTSSQLLKMAASNMLLNRKST